MRIAVDAMGGDHAPRVVVDGAVAAARRLGVGVLLVGPQARLEAELARHDRIDRLEIALRDAPEVVGMDEPPAAGLRRKPGASIRVAAEAVARGEAAALFSAGNTGATVLAAHAALGMLPGVDRPALAATLPTRAGPAVLVDAGATVDCRPRHLVEFARMGRVYARLTLGLAEPRVGLLSIGEEEIKGNDLTREAHRLLREAPLRFIGNIDAHGLYAAEADVVVCDGFIGNVVLKVSEGLVETVEHLLGEELSRTARSRLGAALARGAFERFRRRVDYAEVGGAPLVGLAGLCVVGHGRSSARAVSRALELAQRFAAIGLVDGLAQEVV